MSAREIPRAEQIIAEIRDRITEESWDEANIVDLQRSLPAPSVFGAIVTDIRQRVASGPPDPQPLTLSARKPDHVENARYSAELRYMVATLSRMDDAATRAAERIGECPPSPPTLRGRFSARIIGILSKLLWWYTQSIREALLSVNRRNREQARTLESALSPLNTNLEAQRASASTLAGKVEVLNTSLTALQQTVNNFPAAIISAAIGRLTQTTTALESSVRLLTSEQERLAAQQQELLDRQRLLLNEMTDAGSQSSKQHAELKREIADVAKSVALLEADLLSRLARTESASQPDTGRTVEALALAGQAEAIAVKADLNVASAITHLDTALASIEERIAASRSGDATTGQVSNIAASVTSLQLKFSELGLSNHRLRADLTGQEARIGRVIRELRSTQLPSSAEPETHKADTDISLDRVYLDFEDAFRGSRDEIRERLSIYLPIMKQAGAGKPGRAIVDLGCGRGEWLELLQSELLECKGADKNTAMTGMCRDLGIDIAESGALEYLRAQPDSSLGAITSFHMIEHIPFQDVVALIDEALRVLRPGGLLLLETPNPGNIAVGASNFYLDPTHIRPIPHQTLRFFAEARGFCDLKVLELHPFPATAHLPDNDAAGRRFNECFYGPQDYCLIASRP